MASQKKATRSETLRSIVAALLDGWGKDAVLDAVEAVASTGEAPSKAKPVRRGEKRPASKFLPTVKRLQVPVERKKILLEIVKGFEEGVLFPKASDAKNFLEMRGVHTAHVKDRVAAFGIIFPMLQDMSDEGLRRFLRGSGRTGPAQLGPLADAIRGAGQSLRGKRDAPAEAQTSEGELPLQHGKVR